MESLVQYNAMRAAIVKAHRVDEVKDIRDRAEALRQYAKQSGEGIEQINMVTEIKLRAERRAGELLGDMEKAPGGQPYQSHDVTGRSDIPTLNDLGISRMQSSRWQSIAAIPEPVFENHIASVKADGEELTTASALRLATGIPHLAASNHTVSDTPGYDGDEWYTPAEYIEAARAVMGKIDLDPATCHAAQQTVQANSFYIKEDDSLRDDCHWHGCVWLNPPYSASPVKAFVTKLIQQFDNGNVRQAIIITNNSSDPGRLHNLL